MPVVTGVLEAAVYVDDLDKAEAFYGGVLGLERITRAEGRHVFFRCGPSVVLVFIAKATAIPPAEGALPVPPHGAKGPGHLALFGERRFGCANIHVPVDLHGISPDDLALETDRQVDRRRGLPNPRWPAQHHNFGFAFVHCRFSTTIKACMNKVSDCRGGQRSAIPPGLQIYPPTLYEVISK